MFTITKPTAAAIEHQIAAAAGQPFSASPLLSLRNDLNPVGHLPFGFAYDCRNSCLGQGHAAFAAAKRAFDQWLMFDLGWVRVANPRTPIATGQIVAVEVHTFGLWTLNLSRILEVVDTPTRFGFLYATTKTHVEEGEERFILDFDPDNGDVFYKLEAFSRPRSVLARIGFPFTRFFQHRFARHSHQRMREEVLGQFDDVAVNRC